MSNRKGLGAYILNHEADATANLFDMVQRYHDNQPPYTQRELKNKSSKLLKFYRDSGYRVSTAGNKGASRSSAEQLFHGPEIAFWPNADEHLAGVLQAVPNENKTEVILENIANGVSCVFDDYVMDADAGCGDFELVFIPWFWQDEYRTQVPAGFTADADERYLKQTYDLKPPKVEGPIDKNKYYAFVDDYIQSARSNIELIIHCHQLLESPGAGIGGVVDRKPFPG